MPYVSLPTLTDGSILSAAYLNQLSANVEFLYGQSRQANNAFISYRKFTELIDGADVYWTFTHRLRYFHYSVNCQNYTGVSHIKIDYGPYNDLVNVLTPTAAVIGYVDLEVAAPALVVGDDYQVIVEIFRPGTSIEMTIDFLKEASSTTIS